MTTIRININGEDKVFYPYIDNDELVITNNVVVDQISEEDIAALVAMTEFGSIQEAITKTFDIMGTLRGQECAFMRCWVREANSNGVRILFSRTVVKRTPTVESITVNVPAKLSPEPMGNRLTNLLRTAADTLDRKLFKK